MNKSECLNLCDFLDIYFHIFIAYGNIKKNTADTKQRSQVIVLGCFSIGKTMTCDLCFVPAAINMMEVHYSKHCVKIRV